MERFFTAWVQHCSAWGTVWFGALFWGSILGAVYLRIFPEGSVASVYAASVACGASMGLVAKLRGRWV